MYRNKLLPNMGITLIISALILSSCGGSKAEIPKDYQYGDLSEYIKLAEYKGIEYTKVTGEVSEQETKDYIDDMLSSSSESVEVKEGTVGDDSVVNIDYVGSVDGVEFEGGTAQNQELDIANSTYISGFAEALIGHEVGETFDINVTFPENYGKEELNGKDAVFRITLNSLIQKTKPEYNDEWVRNNSESNTTEEYENYVKEQLAAEKLDGADNKEKNEVFGIILEGSEILQYPDKELADRTERIKHIYEDYASQAGMEFEQFISEQMYMDMDSFNKLADESAKETVRQELVMHAIKNLEGIEIKQAGYNEFLIKMLENAGLTAETFKEQNGKTIAEYANENNLFTSYLYSEVMNKVMEYSVGK